MRNDQGRPIAPELVLRAREGDKSAMEELYLATSQEIYRTVHAMVKNEDLTLDIQQDTYVAAFSRLDQLREPERFLPWLRQIAVNQARQSLRKKTPLLFTELSDGEDFPEAADTNPENLPELALEQKETARLVRELLDELSDGQRLLVGMYYYEQIPIREIAENLNITEGTVKSQLYRSKKKIEAGVKRLEERGVKLFGLAPLPFLTALLRKLEPAAETNRTVMQHVLTETGAAEAAALHVGRRFFETVAGKIVLGLLAAGVLGGGVLGYRYWKELNDRARTDNIHMEVRETGTEAESLEDLEVPDQPPTAPQDPDPTQTETPENLIPVQPPTEATEPAETEATEPETTEPEPTEPPPTAPPPTNPPPTEPQPTAPPTEPQPTAPVGDGSPVPGIQTPTEPTPTSPPPTEPAPTEPPATEPEPTEPEDPNTLSGTAGAGLTWTLRLDTGELILGGSGAIPNNLMLRDHYPLSDNSASVRSVTIQNGVTEIGDYAFCNCSLLTAVSIPASVTKIGSYAFDHCASLNTVSIPDSVRSIGVGAFEDCSNLTGVRLPSGLSTISDSLFSSCFSLSEVSIPGGVTSIGALAFDRCVSLRSVSIPNSVTVVGRGAFSETALSQISLPGSVTRIEGAAFYACLSLSSVTIPTSVTYIGAQAFLDCPCLGSVSVPGSVSEIGDYAFGYYIDSSGSGRSKVTDFTIYGQAGSAAERYAAANEIQFNP